MILHEDQISSSKEVFLGLSQIETEVLDTMLQCYSNATIVNKPPVYNNPQQIITANIFFKIKFNSLVSKYGKEIIVNALFKLIEMNYIHQEKVNGKDCFIIINRTKNN